MFTRSRTSPIIPRSSWRSSSSGSVSRPSSSSASATAAARNGRFIDGPVTANKTLGVHTAWGRTLKDVFQRYKALRGFDQRYQNGFDCQGLWIEVGVERELGLNSKREIEEYGLEEFARSCRDVVVSSAEQLTRRLKRLGQWMDWGNDYFTFSDTNIEYIWKFLQDRPRARLALHGPPLDRSGARAAARRSRSTSYAGGRLPGSSRPVALRPLPARSTGRASRSSSGRRRRGRCRRTSPRPSIRTRSTACARTASGSPSRASPTRRSSSARAARSSSGSRYAGPFDDLPARRRSSIGSSRGTRSRSTRARASSTSRRAAAPRTSSSRACTTCRC